MHASTCAAGEDMRRVSEIGANPGQGVLIELVQAPPWGGDAGVRRWVEGRGRVMQPGWMAATDPDLPVAPLISSPET